MAWLESLPTAVSHLQEKWSLTLGQPFETDASCSWVAPCLRANNSPAVLKLSMPHMEAKQEIDGLLFWQGNPTVFLLEADRERDALLLERCFPGTPLRKRPESEQDQVVAAILKRLWCQPPQTHPFRPLDEMIAAWSKEAEQKLESWADPGLARQGIRLRAELVANTREPVILATDLHAGNILRAKRQPWLAIDPKPFYGDPAYDATQHLLNCQERLATDPNKTIRNFAELLELDYKRIWRWLFARLAAEFDGVNQALARRIGFV